MDKDLNKSQELKKIYEELPKTYQRILLKLANTMQKQAAKGKQKYGHTMDENENTDIEYWKNHLIEEVADGLVYMQKLTEIIDQKDKNPVL